MPKIPSLPCIAITATGRTPADLLDAARRALRYTRFVELRLDWVPKPAEAFRALPALLRDYSAKRPIFIATCRLKPNGGKFRGTVAAQLAILEQAAALGCQLVDLEIESAEALGQDRVAALRQRAGLILSFHDFQRMPRPEKVARRLQKFPADFYKLVGTATRQSDNCAVLDFLKSRSSTSQLDIPSEQRRWIAFCMGEEGIPSRVLALSRGSRFVYASLPPETRQPKEPSEPPAPGQLDWNLLCHRYLADKLLPHFAIYGLVGSPVGQSIGAAIHNAAFQSLHLEAVYIPFLVNNLKDFRKAAAMYPLAGFSVTIPHKQAVLRAADKVAHPALAAGAANTVRIMRTKRWAATNTDIEGIAAPLRLAFRLSAGKSLPKHFRAVILGNGGAARAAVRALRSLHIGTILVTGRNTAKVRRFAHELGLQATRMEHLQRERFDLLVQTTPVGMWPRTAESPLRPDQITAGTVFDLIYNPPVTRLLELAQSKGCRTISGLEMFLAQAARQFRYWTRREPPVRLIRRVALAELRRFPMAGSAGRGAP
jgi:3-dehydroquinate dehydratase/shikimate dehydrogenase